MVKALLASWWNRLPWVGGKLRVVHIVTAADEIPDRLPPKYYICCFSLCERAAAQRGTRIAGSGYMPSPPSGRRGSPGRGGEAGVVVGPAGAGLVAAAPV